MWHALALLALLPGQGNDEGEKVFRQMEVKVSKAKAFDIAFDINLEAGLAGKLNGTLTSMSGNKVCLEMAGEFMSNPAKMLMVSDGTRMRTTSSGKAGAAQETPVQFDERIRAMVTRAGVFSFIFNVEAGKRMNEFKPDEQLAVSEFRLGKTEKLGEREAQVVEYKLTMKPVREPFSVTVWIDSKTSFPLKRVLTGNLEAQKTTVTETYTKLVLDGKLDEKKFELPK